MRRMWFGIIISIPLYVYMGESLKRISWLEFRNAGKLFLVLSVLCLGEFLWFRTKRYSGALQAAKRQPDDIGAVRLWMNG